ncbi:3-oxoacyl-ACP synthase [Plantibacter flavus]|uniref:beta-ketoacyl synthase N-terminal-like domain-containing protein n=1 Tax=Plantibacter TaxID=190323 RepID=UPI0010C165BD|nr:MULTISPECIES: beta-ketoacyl synthase N-terminal-like domain-containing protein [Plantibacter]MBD8104618.1 beta-ketoacyl-[acyl-carrier-protein] synthase family protein [Plantibacter sp. CFBP 8775]MBD8535136.1 beta-ketoacyl-[acyl-carrier-protein] synthase family protein [Plantibacter sp. CFBP 13570]TKJ95876.1 3-oxoacyl-ACP synthase [Plantibacter flavus]
MTTTPVLHVLGLGAVSAAGVGVGALWRAMKGDRPAPRRTDDEALSAPVRSMFRVGDDEVLGHRAAGFGITAAREALDEAAGRGFDGASLRLAVVVGTGMGETTGQEAARSSDGRASEQSAFETATLIADAVGATGPVVCVSNACAASAYALGHAVDLLSVGEADAALVVGAEAYSRSALAAFNRLGALDAEGCRPFAVDRRGTVFGEGAGALLLVPETHPAEPVARVVGSAFSCDATHPTAPDESGEQLERAFLSSWSADQEGPDAVIPHGTGTQRNDAVEATMLEARRPDAPWFSLKALLGHTGGASASLAFVAACLISANRLLPANVDVGEPIPSAAPRLPAAAVTWDVPPRIAVNASAFGGSNSTVLFEGIPT